MNEIYSVKTFQMIFKRFEADRTFTYKRGLGITNVKNVAFYEYV